MTMLDMLRKPLQELGHVGVDGEGVVHRERSYSVENVDCFVVVAPRRLTHQRGPLPREVVAASHGGRADLGAVQWDALPRRADLALRDERVYPIIISGDGGAGDAVGWRGGRQTDGRSVLGYVGYGA